MDSGYQHQDLLALSYHQVLQKNQLTEEPWHCSTVSPEGQETTAVSTPPAQQQTPYQIIVPAQELKRVIQVSTFP